MCLSNKSNRKYFSALSNPLLRCTVLNLMRFEEWIREGMIVTATGPPVSHWQ